MTTTTKSHETKRITGPRLSSDEIHRFQSDGYLVVRGVFDPDLCRRYVDDHVKKAMEEYGGLREGDPTTYDTDITRRMATGEGYAPPIGVMIRKGQWDDPLPDGPDWIFQNTKLLSVLDQIHDDYDDNDDNNNSYSNDGKDKSATNDSKKRSWEWLHSSNNLGWIHVRLPHIGPNRTNDSPTEPKPRWHVDGGHFTPHLLTSPEQSVVILPMLRGVEKGGGNTLVIRGSHLEFGRLLHRSDGLSKDETQDCRDIVDEWQQQETPSVLFSEGRLAVDEIAPCDAGDALLLHPHVIHAAGFHTNQNTTQLRVAFNLGTKWTRQPEAVADRSILEATFAMATQDTKQPMKPG